MNTFSFITIFTVLITFTQASKRGYWCSRNKTDGIEPPGRLTQSSANRTNAPNVPVKIRAPDRHIQRTVVERTSEAPPASSSGSSRGSSKRY